MATWTYWVKGVGPPLSTLGGLPDHLSGHGFFQAGCKPPPGEPVPQNYGLL